MSAPLKFNGLDTLFSLIFSKSSSGFSAFRIWKLPIASRSTEHRATAFLTFFSFISGETNLVLRRIGLSVAGEGGLTSD